MQPKKMESKTKSNQEIMKREEQVNFRLRALYQQYGYRQFKMGKFEEYELYARNKDFISAERIITFNDVDGKLMALKPDLTLSIVKNYRPAEGYVEKVYYSENIYRAARDTHGYREILQTGLECLGDIDLYHLCEVTVLAAKSLAAMSSDYVLEISHMGLVRALLGPVAEDVQEKLLRCISEKNLHELRSLCADHGVDGETAQKLDILVSTYGPYKKVLSRLRKLGLSSDAKAALDELDAVCNVLAVNKLARNINIDFSIVNDMSYYNGILYKGFIKGIPTSVLSGGQYDRLVERMGKTGGAVGFAVYFDHLERLAAKEKKYDFDVVLLYDENSQVSKVLGVAKALRQEGRSVLVERHLPEKLSCRQLMRITAEEVRTVADND